MTTGLIKWLIRIMARNPRLDTPGALHHVMGRGIDGIDIFEDKKDWMDFLGRLKGLCESKASR